MAENERPGAEQTARPGVGAAFVWAGAGSGRDAAAAATSPPPIARISSLRLSMACSLVSRSFLRARPMSWASQLDSGPLDVTPADQAPLQRVEREIADKHDDDKCCDSGEQRRRIIGLRCIENEMPQSGIGADIFADHRAKHRVGHGGLETDEDLIPRRR